ncbi:hypothetical protein AURDEDRAFT_110248 [Auricularia subglabra TFB-10046 SS5]|nr:hypothetical protein AURDEDRAFT_110248 [Auricularia subglabra TFB-10046 SS5]
MADVIVELFGNIPLPKLLEGLESDIDDLLWVLEAPLGEAAYQRIVAAQRPARELAQTMRSRRNEAPLADAFRDAVLASTKLYALLTPAAKARVNGSTHEAEHHGGDAPPPSYDEHHQHRTTARQPTPPPPPQRQPIPPRAPSPPPQRAYQPPLPPRAVTPQPPPRAAPAASTPSLDVFLPEITSASQLSAEVGAVGRPGGKPLVVLFLNPSSPASQEFLPLFACLVPEYKDAKFMMLSVKRAGMEEIMETLSVSLLPTVLTFCSDGFFRTTGKDLGSIRSDVTRAIRELLEGNVSKQWPRAPVNWGQSSALALWRGLPNTVQEIATFASVDHGIRVHLLHTLPYIEDRDPNAYKVLKDATVMKHFCGHFFAAGEVMYSCYDCGVNGQFADFCEKCWSNASHTGHTAIKRPAPNDSFMCDCGRLSKSGSGDVIGSHCTLHQDTSSTDALATLFALSMMLNASSR